MDAHAGFDNSHDATLLVTSGDLSWPPCASIALFSQSTQQYKSFASSETCMHICIQHAALCQAHHIHWDDCSLSDHKRLCTPYGAHRVPMASQGCNSLLYASVRHMAATRDIAGQRPSQCHAVRSNCSQVTKPNLSVSQG